MARPRGVRAQDHAAMKQFEYMAKNSPPIVSIKPIEVRIACPCSFRPYPHILTDAAQIDRHRRGVPK